MSKFNPTLQTVEVGDRIISKPYVGLTCSWIRVATVTGVSAITNGDRVCCVRLELLPNGPGPEVDAAIETVWKDVWFSSLASGDF